VRIANLVQAVVRSSPAIFASLIVQTQTILPAAAQTAAVSAGLPPKPEFKHHRKITTVYAAERDTTTVSVILQKGTYFLWIQKPRVVVAYQHAGAVAPTGVAAEVMLIEFRTQEPQFAATNRLTITGVGGQGGGDTVRVEAVASRSRLEGHAFTNDHRLTFDVPATDAASLLAAQKVVLDVGGVVVRLKEEQLEAWRELAWGMRGGGR
jgi:hypothetical protein